MAESPIRILLVEDNPADARLFAGALELSAAPHSLDIVCDGQKALDFLYRREPYAGAPRPDLIVMDTNLPRVSGVEILRQIKADDSLVALPVLILGDGSESDVLRAYQMHANCYVSKASDVDAYVESIKLTVEYWSRVVRLPRRLQA